MSVKFFHSCTCLFLLVSSLAFAHLQQKLNQHSKHLQATLAPTLDTDADTEEVLDNDVSEVELDSTHAHHVSVGINPDGTYFYPDRVGGQASARRIPFTQNCHNFANTIAQALTTKGITVQAMLGVLHYYDGQTNVVFWTVSGQDFQNDPLGLNGYVYVGFAQNTRAQWRPQPNLQGYDTRYPGVKWDKKSDTHEFNALAESVNEWGQLYGVCAGTKLITSLLAQGLHRGYIVCMAEKLLAQSSLVIRNSNVNDITYKQGDFVPSCSTCQAVIPVLMAQMQN